MTWPNKPICLRSMPRSKRRVRANMDSASQWSQMKSASWRKNLPSPPKKISELIQSIQKEARRAVENMEKSTSIVNEGLNLGQDLNAALRKISNVVTEVYKFAQEIGAPPTSSRMAHRRLPCHHAPE